MYTIKFFTILLCLCGLLTGCTADSEKSSPVNTVDSDSLAMLTQASADISEPIPAVIEKVTGDSSELYSDEFVPETGENEKVVLANNESDAEVDENTKLAKTVSKKEKEREAQKAKDRARKRDQKRNSKASISFKEMVHNYGRIAQGDKVNHKFKFTNNGTSELVITNAKATCGCTQPSFPFVPIAPGEEGYIGVVFDSKGKMGRQKPMITITTNAKPATYEIFLEGFVDAPEVDKEKIEEGSVKIKEETSNN